MANHFDGQALEEHYEKELKDFRPIDWAMLFLLFAPVVAAVVMGFMQKWGIMVILAGCFICMIHIFLLVVFGVRNKIMLGFFCLGIAVIIGGIITATENYNLLVLYGVFIYILVSFGVGFLCLYLAAKKRRKIKEYTLLVEADCELVDVKKINMFRFDDIVKNSYDHSLNDNTLTKPGFHYFVNGEEYFTESTVYYGDLNTDYVEGAKVTLRVNPNNPTDILPKNEGAGLEMIMGISWVVIGIISLAVIVILWMTGILTIY